MAKINVYCSLLPSDHVIGWDIKMTSYPNSNASFNKNDVWNAKIPSAAQRSVYGTNSKYIGAECPPPNWVKKKPLQPGNQPGEVSNNKYMYICSSKKWSHCETAALWNSLGTCKTSSTPFRFHWKPNCQRRSSLSLVAVLLISWVQPPILTISSNLAIVAKLGDPKCL